MEVGEGVPPLSVSAGLTQVVVRGEVPQRRRLPLPSCFLFWLSLIAIIPHYHYAKIILPLRYRD